MPSRRKNQLPPLAELQALLDYDPDTGVLTWKVGRHAVPAGTQAGTIEPRGGFLRVTVSGVRHQATAVIWKLMTGEDPELDIDHRDRDPSNNRWQNLRQATHAENSRNRKGWSKAGEKGIYPRYLEGKETRDKRIIRGWRAIIIHDGKRVQIGEFKDIEAARAARHSAMRKYHQDFAAE